MARHVGAFWRPGSSTWQSRGASIQRGMGRATSAEPRGSAAERLTRSLEERASGVRPLFLGDRR